MVRLCSLPAERLEPIAIYSDNTPLADLGFRHVSRRDGILSQKGKLMHTVTKKEVADRIASQTGTHQTVVKKIVQVFLDQIIDELAHSNRLEFRDFGIFEIKNRSARIGQNPKTLERVSVPPKRTVKFKVGRVMKLKVQPDPAREKPQPPGKP